MGSLESAGIPYVAQPQDVLRRHVLDLYLRSYWLDPPQLVQRMNWIATLLPERLKRTIHLLQERVAEYHQHQTIRGELIRLWAWCANDRPLATN